MRKSVWHTPGRLPASAAGNAWRKPWRPETSTPRWPAGGARLATARNLVANELRAQRRQRGLIDKLGSTELARRESPQDDVGAAVREVLETLRPHHREILILAYWDAMSLAEISAILRCSVGSAKSRLFRARKAFSHKAPNQMLKGGTENGQR